MADIDRDRRVTFLELFYDLVYVVLIADLAHALAEHISLSSVLNFAFLFIFVWWAWVNGTMYFDLHGNNDLRTRVFTFIQMLTVASMAVFVHSALDDGSVGFALSFVAYQLILTYLSWRTGVHDPTHRPLSGYNSLLLLTAAVLVFASVFVPSPARFVLWAVAVVSSLLIPLFLNRWRAQDQQFLDQVNHVWSLSKSAVERFGLLTIIVLGEVVVGAVRGVAKHDHIDLEIGISAALGILIAIGMWWVYFDFVSHRLPRSGEKFAQGWMYFHLPMTMGITATGAAVLNIVVLTGESISGEVRWLLVGATASTLVAVAVLIRMIHIAEDFRMMYRTGEIMILASAIAILLLGFTRLETIPLLVLMVLLLLTPALYGIKVWLVEFGAEIAETDSNIDEAV